MSWAQWRHTDSSKTGGFIALLVDCIRVLDFDKRSKLQEGEKCVVYCDMMGLDSNASRRLVAAHINCYIAASAFRRVYTPFNE
jgi:hypothetical protein